MKPKFSDALIGLMVVIVIGGFFWFIKNRNSNQNPETTPFVTSSPVGSVKGIEDSFRITLPVDSDKKELKDISGDGENYSGVVSRKYSNNKFDLLVLADLPDLQKNEKYLLVLSKPDGSQINIGNLETGKGGYMLEVSKQEDLTSYSKIQIKKLDKVLLEASY